MLELILTREDANTEFAHHLVVARRGRRQRWRTGSPSASSRRRRRPSSSSRRAKGSSCSCTRRATRSSSARRSLSSRSPPTSSRGFASSRRAGAGAPCGRSPGPGDAQGCGARRASRDRPLRRSTKRGSSPPRTSNSARPRPGSRAGAGRGSRARRCLDRRRHACPRASARTRPAGLDDPVRRAPARRARGRCARFRRSEKVELYRAHGGARRRRCLPRGGALLVAPRLLLERGARLGAGRPSSAPRSSRSVS